MTKFVNNNIAIQYSITAAKPQILAACKLAGVKGRIQNGDLVVYDATRALVDTLLSLEGVYVYGAKKLRNGDVATVEITDSSEMFGVDVVAQFLASKAEEYAELEAKADAALDAVDALLGGYAQEAVEEVEKEEEVAEVEAEPIHYEVEFSGKEFAKALREIKKVDGRKFDATLKVWTIPASTNQSKIDWLVSCGCTVSPVYAPKK